LSAPLELLKVLRHLSRKLAQTANDQLEFMVQRLFLVELLALGFDLRNPLSKPPQARLEFLFFNQAFRIAINEAGHTLVQLNSLALQDHTLLVLLLAIRVEAAVELLG
jgi:hypothetical protein